MDLKGLIRPQLWNEISNSYVADNYKTAILDAFHYLTNIIREKSGLDGAGVALIGQAFGGDDPKLRINRLQTRSEKDEQKGFQQVLTGLYTAIRNPRTHEDTQDDKNVADPIIYFVHYILTILDVSKPPFSMDEFLPRVYDKDFVERKDYTEELIKEIPSNRRLETLIEIYRQKDNGEGKTLALVCREILARLTDAEIEEFTRVVSEELDVISDEKKITKIIQILPSHIWPKIKKTARMRIENKLIASIKEGDAIINQEKIRAGHFGSWSTNLIEVFTLKDELISAISMRLFSSDPENSLYILKFFIDYLPSLYEESDMERAVDAMHRVVARGDIRIKGRIASFALDAPDEWRICIREVFRDFTDEDKPSYYFKDGTPFLGKVPPYVEDDDIPF